MLPVHDQYRGCTYSGDNGYFEEGKTVATNILQVFESQVCKLLASCFIVLCKVERLSEIWFRWSYIVRLSDIALVIPIDYQRETVGDFPS